MTLEQLRIFLAVAAAGHVTRAARQLNLTQSAVSAAIAALESRHGVPLFDRVGRGIAITEAGQALVPAAEAVLARAEAARVLLEDLAQDTAGTLRIHASQTVASYWLPARMMALHDRHPRIAQSLTVGNTTQVARAVAEGAADIGLVEGELPGSDLHRQVVARDELVLVMAAGHPAAAAPMGAAAYRGLRWIFREEGSGTRAAAVAHLVGLGLGPGDLDVVLELPSNEAVLAAVAAGGCVAMLSARAVAAADARGLVRRPVDWAPAPVRPFAVLTDPARHRTRAVAAMLALLAETPVAAG